MREFEMFTHPRRLWPELGAHTAVDEKVGAGVEDRGVPGGDVNIEVTDGSVVEGFAADDGGNSEDDLQVISRAGFLTWMFHTNSYNRNGIKEIFEPFQKWPDHSGNVTDHEGEHHHVTDGDQGLLPVPSGGRDLIGRREVGGSEDGPPGESEEEEDGQDHGGQDRVEDLQIREGLTDLHSTLYFVYYSYIRLFTTL